VIETRHKRTEKHTQVESLKLLKLDEST